MLPSEARVPIGRATHRSVQPREIAKETESREQSPSEKQVPVDGQSITGCPAVTTRRVRGDR